MANRSARAHRRFALASVPIIEPSPRSALGSAHVGAAIPILGFAAVSGTGKTTLLRQLIPLLREGDCDRPDQARAPQFDIDKPGKDSYQLRKAGATRVLVGSDHRWALIVENDGPTSPMLDDLLHNLHTDALDLVLVEGFKLEPYRRSRLDPPGWVSHPAPGRSLHHRSGDGLPHFVAIDRPVLDLNRPGRVADFIHEWLLAR